MRKIILVTGGARGIGSETVKQLFHCGSNIYIQPFFRGGSTSLP